jgi:ribosome-binding protein aMBF1 (putative translation factor)
MTRKKRPQPPRSDMIWSRKFQMWIDRDTRSPERRAKDEAIVRSVEADEARIKEALREAEAMQSKHMDAMNQAAESLADSVLRALFDARKKAGLTQVEVAARMGVPQSAVVRLESGMHSPTLTTLTRYAAAIGVKLEVRRIA